MKDQKMKSRHFDFFNFVSGLVLFIFVSIACLFAYVFALVATGSVCENQSRMMGLEHHFTHATGCMVKLDNVWVKMIDVVPVNVGNSIKYVSRHKVRVEFDMTK